MEKIRHKEINRRVRDTGWKPFPWFVSFSIVQIEPIREARALPY